jgi:hypothetical protein
MDKRFGSPYAGAMLFHAARSARLARAAHASPEARRRPLVFILALASALAGPACTRTSLRSRGGHGGDGAEPSEPVGPEGDAPQNNPGGGGGGSRPSEESEGLPGYELACMAQPADLDTVSVTVECALRHDGAKADLARTFTASSWTNELGADAAAAGTVVTVRLLDDASSAHVAYVISALDMASLRAAFLAFTAVLEYRLTPSAALERETTSLPETALQVPTETYKDLAPAVDADADRRVTETVRRWTNGDISHIFAVETLGAKPVGCTGDFVILSRSAGNDAVDAVKAPVDAATLVPPGGRHVYAHRFRVADLPAGWSYTLPFDTATIQCGSR